MNNAQVKALRELGNHGQDGDFCIVDKNNRIIMGWITSARAEEYSVYYPESKVLLLRDWSGYYSKQHIQQEQKG